MARVFVSGTADRLAHLDVLRGIAILGVVACHHVLELPAIESRWALASVGRLGVQVFFVVSAVTLCRSAERGGRIRDFYARRFWRIAPVYYAGLLLYAVVREGLPGLAPADEPQTLYAPANVAANLVFVHGFVPGAYNHVVPGGWSIGVEMVFYALFPAMFAGARWLHRRGGVGALVVATAVCWASCLMAQLGCAAWLGRGPDDPFIHSSIVNQLPVFMVGITAHFARECTKDAGRRAMLVAIPLLALVLRSVPLVDQIVPATAAVMAAFMLAALQDRAGDGGLLARIGRRSYSMYILHFLPTWTVGAMLGG